MKKIIFTLAACISLTGCNKFLDIKPYDRTIPETTEDFSALLHKMCDGIDNGSTIEGCIVGNYGDTQWFETISDNMATNLTGSTDILANYVGTQLSAKQSEYKNLYQIIRDCNIILGELKDDRDTRETKDIIGTVYAIRGVCYYQLIRQYCAPPLATDGNLGVPIVTEFDMEARPIRSSMEETISQAERDFRTALEYDVQEEMYRFNNDIIHGYLARLYHWCGRWEEARSEAKLVLDAHPLLAGDDYAKMMSTQFGLVGNKLIMADRLAENQRAIEYSMNYMEQRPLSAEYATLFTEGTRDVRRRSNLFFNRKRKNRKLFFSGMRSAEMALIAMECAYHLKQEANALTELNDFRSKRIDGDYAYTMQTLPAVDSNALVKQDATGQPLTPLIQAILNERRKEFYLENGDRWFELKRNGRPEFWVGILGMKYWTRNYMYTFPIPISDIQQQPGILQNPGYEETY